MDYREGFKVSVRLIIGEYGEYSFETPQILVVPRESKHSARIQQLSNISKNTSVKPKELPQQTFPTKIIPPKPNIICVQARPLTTIKQDTIGVFQEDFNNKTDYQTLIASFGNEPEYNSQEQSQVEPVNIHLAQIFCYNLENQMIYRTNESYWLKISSSSVIINYPYAQLLVIGKVDGKEITIYEKHQGEGYKNGIIKDTYGLDIHVRFFSDVFSNKRKEFKFELRFLQDDRFSFNFVGEDNRLNP